MRILLKANLLPALLLLVLAGRAVAQTESASAQAQAQASAPASAQAPAPAGPQLLDRVVAIVNGDVLLQSDVEEEARFAAFQPFSDRSNGEPQKEALDRLIDRALIEQQMHSQSATPQITDEELDKELKQLRNELPACAKYACRTDAGWKRFCTLQGFTPEEVRERWHTRMVLLAFIEQRFRTGIRISQADIAAYYSKEFVPRFKEKHLTPPPLDSVSQRIQEILLQQKVTVLLSDWLNSLRDQGSVQVLDPSLVDSQAKPATELDSPATQ